MNLTAICAAVAFAVGAGTTYKLTADHYAAAEAKQQQAAAEAYQARTVELNAIAVQLEQSRHDRKTVYRTITRDVEKVVTRDLYRSACLDDDGVLLVNSALAGRTNPGQPDAAVSSSAAAGRQDRR
jgi:hypothetical protein